jgi:hypothetical protein
MTNSHNVNKKEWTGNQARLQWIIDKLLYRCDTLTNAAGFPAPEPHTYMTRKIFDVRAFALSALDPFVQIARLMAFRHDGKNLPLKLDSQTLALIFLATALGWYRWSILGGETFSSVVLSYMVATFGFALVLPLPIVTITVMGCIGADTIAIALGLSGFDACNGTFAGVLLVWMVAATWTTSQRWRAKYQPASKPKQTNTPTDNTK